jgi:hypothetical protein
VYPGNRVPGFNPTSYIVYRSTSSNGTYTPLDTVTVLYFNDSVFLNGLLLLQGQCCQQMGEGNLSNYTYGYALGPSAPIALSVSYDIYPAGILFTWNKSSGAASYIVSRASYASGTKTILDTVSDTSFLTLLFQRSNPLLLCATTKCQWINEFLQYAVN